MRQQMDSMQATLESLVRQQCTLTSQVNSLQKQEELVLEEAVIPFQAQKSAVYPQMMKLKMFFLPTSVPVGVPPDCTAAAAPIGVIVQDEVHRMTD